MSADLSAIARLVMYGLAGLTLLAAWRVVTGRNLFHSALALGLALVGVAGLYLGLAADFLAVTQVLIYVGAVLTLIVFAIMLTTGFGDPTIPQANQQRAAAAAIALGLWVMLVQWIWMVPWAQWHQPIPRATVAALGRELLLPYALPFELISVIFVACLVGAIAIAASPPRHPSGRQP